MCVFCQQTLCVFEAPLQTISPETLSQDGLADLTDTDVAEAVSALATDYRWYSTTVSFGFPESGDDYAGKTTYAGEEEEFLSLSDAGEDMVRAAAAEWDAVAGLNIVEDANDPEIAIGGSSKVSSAWAYLPEPDDPATGDIWIGVDRSYNALFVAESPTPYIGSYEYYVSMHEFGHALGLKHPHQGVAASGSISGNYEVMESAYDAMQYSVMSYRSYVGSGTSSLTVEDGHYPQSIMMLDIAAIQEMYGANYTTLSGNTTYRFTPTEGAMYINGVSTGETMANVIFRTLWDGGGTDLIDLSAYTTSIGADLRAGGAIALDTDGNAQRALLRTIAELDPVYASGNIYMSLLFEGNTASLIENIITGTGDDTIIGNQADNVITPGLGTDIVDGGSGFDTVILDAEAATTLGLFEDDVLWLDYAGGSVELTNVEYVEFTDTSYDVASLISALNGSTVPVLLTGATSEPTSTVSGVVFVDLDADNIFDSDETVIEGATVFYDFDGDMELDSWELSTQTDASGVYSFSEIPAGTYPLVMLVEEQEAVIESQSQSVEISTDGAHSATVNFALAPSPYSQQVIAEFGNTINIIGDWKTVRLDHDFDNPVVFAMVTSQNNAEAISIRVKGVKSGQFKVKLDAVSNSDTTLVGEDISFVVMEEGSWSLSDGRRIEVGSFQTDLLTSENFTAQSYDNSFDETPHLFSTLQTYNGEDYVNPRHASIGKNGFSFAMEEEELLNDGGHTNETIGWFAIEGGVSQQDDIILEANSMTKVDERVDQFNFNGDHTEDVGFLANTSSFKGADPGNIRVQSLTETGTSLFFQEDQSKDSETAHANENVDIFAFSVLGSDLLTGYSYEDAPAA